MLMLLALIPGIPEKFENIRKVWVDLLKLDEIDCVISGDLKIINLLLGIMSHSSSFPCPYCIAPKVSLAENCGKARTLELIRTNASDWVKDGANAKYAKDFYCCTNRPMICGLPDVEIVSLCPPPVLYIVLGIVNAIFKKVQSQNSEVSEQWARKSNCAKHTQFGFNGRDCHKLIKNRHMLLDSSSLTVFHKV